MFAFENWHSALEMKLYIRRYIHHIGGLPDFSALRFTRYNQYESMILPMIKYLEGFGVQFHYNAKVENVDFKIGGGMGPVRSHTGTGQDTILKKQAESGVFVRNPYSSPTKKMATRIDLTEADGTARSIDLGENDLVFITNGGCVEKFDHGLANRSGRMGSGNQARRRLGHVASHCQARPEFRSPGRVLRRSGAFEVDERHRDHA